MTGAPDFTRALVGFRAWRASDDGWLHPWSLGAAGPWQPGVNTARCHAHVWRAGPAPRHRAPATHCMCGIYALAGARDRRLHGDGDQVVGAIAAWGDVELHRTGFRAEHATVVALARPRHGAVPAPLAAAAGRYGVELVPWGELADAAGRWGSPIDASFVTELERREAAAARRRVGETGIDLDRHVWARALEDVVETGPTPALRELLADDPQLTVPPAGTRVAAGDVLAVATRREGRAYLVWCAVGGTIAAVDPAMRHGWLARIDDATWDGDQDGLVFGRRAETAYAALVALRHTGRDVFGDVLHEQHLTAPVTCAADVLRELERRRATRRITTPAELYAACAPALIERVQADRDGARRAARAALTLRIRTHDPDAELWIDARDDDVRVQCGARRGATADLTLTSADAATTVSLFSGRLDVSRALRARELQSDAPLPRTLGALSVLKAVLQEPGPQRWR